MKIQSILPKPLEIGDTIALTAPSSPVAADQVGKAREYLEARGFQVRLGETLGFKNGYLAGTDVDRATELSDLFRDRSVQAIFAARGGYGSGRLLDRIDYRLIRRKPKILVGFSDATALQLAIYRRTGLISWSGVAICPDLSEGYLPPETHDSLWNALLRRETVDIPDLQAIQPGDARGNLVPGCLSVICSILGTPYLPNLNGAILVLEDVGEGPYRIDRMLNQFRLAGILENLAGLVFGCFTKAIDDPRIINGAEELFREYAQYVAGPVAMGLVYGHVRGRLVLPMGQAATLAVRPIGGALRYMISDPAPGERPASRT